MYIPSLTGFAGSYDAPDCFSTAASITALNSLCGFMQLPMQKVFPNESFPVLCHDEVSTRNSIESVFCLSVSLGKKRSL